ncbi:calcium-binding protein [Ochrobactrum teleogrylli]|uniref:Calcium-binding protein n=1 Tax=Ochrobactrum teleogrylli TaxID=2479765 RepID=A0ABD5K128_9HYPH
MAELREDERADALQSSDNVDWIRNVSETEEFNQFGSIAVFQAGFGIPAETARIYETNAPVSVGDDPQPSEDTSADGANSSIPFTASHVSVGGAATDVDDLVQGGPGADWLWGDGGDDMLLGGEGDDYLDGGTGNDFLDGGGGRDSLNDGDGDDILLGGDGADVLYSYDGDDYLDGGNGNDRLASFGGNDVIRGGDGDDWIDASRDCFVDGGTGYDILAIEFGKSETPIVFDAASGTTATGLTFLNIEGISSHVAGDQNNQLLGSEASEAFFSSSSGNDVLDGGSGNDTLVDQGILHGSGDDRLFGGEGNDRLQNDGGGGSDELTGGPGADTFSWFLIPPSGEGVDRILDFDGASGDRIEFSETAQGVTGIDDFDAFLAASRDVEDGVYISFNGTDDFGILVENVSLADLAASDIVFDVGGA